MNPLRSHLIAGDYAAVLGAFRSLSTLASRCGAELGGLLDDLAFVLRQAPTPMPHEAQLVLPCGAKLDRVVLSMLETILREHQSELTRDPSTLFPLLYNELFWLDCPQRSEHEDPPTNTEGRQLWRWMEAWRSEHRSPWLRRLRPPAVLAAALPSWSIEGAPIALSPDGGTLLVRRAVPSYASNTPWSLTDIPLPAEEHLVTYGVHAQLRSINRLEPLASLVHQSEVRSALFVGQGRLLLTATTTQAHAWRGTDGARVAASDPGPLTQLLPTDDGPVFLYHPDGLRLWSFAQTYSTNIKGPVSNNLQRTLNGKTIEYRFSTRSCPSELRLIDAHTGLPRLSFAVNTSMFGRLSPDGSVLLVCTQRGAQLWSTQTLAPLAVLGPFEDRVEGACFSLDNEVAYLATRTALLAFRVADGARIAAQPMKCDGPLLPAGEGRVLSYDGSAWHLWDHTKGAILGAPMPSGWHQYCAISPRGDTLITSVSSNGVMLLVGWALPECRELFSRKGTGQGLLFDPDGATFTLDNYEAKARYDATTGEPLPKGDIRPLDPHQRFRLSYLGYDASSSRLVLHDVNTGRSLAQIPRAGASVLERRRYFSADGRVLVVGDEKTSQLADLSSLAAGSGWRDDDAKIILDGSPCFSPSGATLLVNIYGGLTFWDVTRGCIRQRYPGEDRRLIFDNGGMVLARRGDLLIARSMEDGSERWQTRYKAPEVQGSEWSHAADSEGLVICDNRGGEVIALDSATGQERYRLSDANFLSVCGALLVTESAAKVASLRDVVTGKALPLTLPPSGRTYVLSPDRRLLLRGGSYHGIEVWELSTGTLRHTINTDASSFWIQPAPLSIVTYESQTQQSGNQDLNIETTYDLETGALLSRRSWWDHDATPSPPKALAPGVLLQENSLSLHGTTLVLPSEAKVQLTQSGSLYVASVSRGRLDLYVVCDDAPQ